MGLLYFWTEGKHDPTGELLSESACVLALAFVWMKSWQALFCSRLTTHLQGDIPESWTLRRIVRLIAVQTALQPWSLFFLPFALLLAAPFGWIYSFYESLTVVGDGRSEPLSTVCSRAWQQAKLWPAQNHCIIWLLSPYLLLWVAAMLLWGIPIFQSAIPEWSLGILWLTGSLAALLMLALSPLAVVTGINLALVDPRDADHVAAAIARRAPGMRVASTQASDTAADPFVVLDRFHWAIAIVTVTGSTAFLLALMVMRAEQRRDIIGILRLIGVSSRSILLEVLLEGLLIAVAGAMFGILVAVAAQGAINRFFQWRFDTTLVFVRVTATIAWEAVAFAVPLGVAAGLAASWTLLRRSVVSLVGR